MDNGGTKAVKVKGSEIFVGGLQQSAKEEMIREAFQKFGEIVEVRLMKDQKGNLKGYSFVRFTTKEAALKAQKEKDGTMLQGKKIRVSPSTDQDRIFIGSLKKEWTHEEVDRMVRQAFQDVVDVELAVVPEGTSGPKKRLNRGFGFITFKDHSAAARAYRIGSKLDFTLEGSWHPIVDWAQSENEFDPDELAKVTVGFVSNLPSNATENYLRKLFEPYGKLERVAISKKANIPVGFVHFTSRADLDTAIKELDGKVVDGVEKGQTVKLQVAVSKPMDKSKKRSREESEFTPIHTDGAHRRVDTDAAYPAPRLIVDPYELSVLGLQPNVTEKLLQIFQRGIVSQHEVDIHVLESLRDLSESIAVGVLDKFASADLADVRSKGGYLANLIQKARKDAGSHRKGPKRETLLDVSRLNVGVTPRASALDGYNLTRTPMDSGLLQYGGGYSSLLSLGAYPSLTGGLTDTTLLSRLGDTHGLTSYESSSTSLNYGLGTLGSLGAVGSLGGLGGGYSGLGSLGVGREMGSSAKQRPFKFDPYTGEPYKFDPFTGEPLQHSGSRQGSRYM